MAQPKAPTVLIVDDSPLNRAAFEAVLDRDFNVTLVESGLDALAVCRNQNFAVILLDVRMPGMDGFETAAALRKNDRTRTTPIIFVSAYDQTLAKMTRGYVAGATDYIFNPVEDDLLRLKVATFAQIHLRQEALRENVQQLNKTVQLLHEELERKGLTVTSLELRIRELEKTASKIDQQTADLSGPP
jgi:PleD family two-component response regulator